MLLLPPSSSGPPFSPTLSKLEKEMPELSCERRVNLLCSYLIWSEDQLGIKVFFGGGGLFHFEFSFSLWGLLCSSQPLWLFCILVLVCSPSCSLSLAFAFYFSLALFSLPSPGVIQGSGVGSKEPLKCWLLWEYFKRPFHHVHEAALETKLKYDLCEEASINSLESFFFFFYALYSYIPLFCAVVVRFCCLFVVLQSIIFRSSCMYIMSRVQGKGQVRQWTQIGVNYI